MKQLINFVPSKGGTQSGYCLRNVRLGFGIPALYNDAWQAWKNTKQYTGAIPTGVDVPLYYDYTDRAGNRFGHINVRLKDGRIWNDGRYYNSLTSFQNSMSNVKYVGWSDAVNNVKVLEVSMRTPNVKDVKDYFKVWLKRNPTDSQISHYTSNDFRKLFDDVLGAYRAYRNEGEDRLVAREKELETQIANQKKEISSQAKEIESLKAQVGDNTKWETLKALIRELIGSK